MKKSFFKLLSYLLLLSFLISSCDKFSDNLPADINLNDTYWQPVYAKGQVYKDDPETKFEGKVNENGILNTHYKKNNAEVPYSRNYSGYHFYQFDNETVFSLFDLSNRDLESQPLKYHITKGVLYLETLTPLDDIYSSSAEDLMGREPSGEYEAYALYDVSDDSMTFGGVTYKKLARCSQ